MAVDEEEISPTEGSPEAAAPAVIAIAAKDGGLIQLDSNEGPSGEDGTSDQRENNDGNMAL